MPIRTPIVLPVTGPYTAKDQRKADLANKFIGRGSQRSSTNSYSRAFGTNANCGRYAAEDVVFVSAEGARSGRLDPDFDEIKRASDASATLVTDGIAERSRSYNVGERQVATFIASQGYAEKRPGFWTKHA